MSGWTLVGAGSAKKRKALSKKKATPRPKDPGPNDVLAEDRALSHYGLTSLKDIPIARYNLYMGHSYPVWRRGDLAIAKMEKEQKEFAERVAANEVAEQELERQYGGKEGLKRKRDDDAAEAEQQKAKYLFELDRSAKVARMAVVVEDMFAADISISDTALAALPKLDTNMAKPQAKTMFRLTDPGIVSVVCSCS